MTYEEQVDALLAGTLDRAVLSTDPALERLDEAIACVAIGYRAAGVLTLMKAERYARDAGDRELAGRLLWAFDCFETHYGLRRSHDGEQTTTGSDDPR